jgi:hypothetical protein
VPHGSNRRASYPRCNDGIALPNCWVIHTGNGVVQTLSQSQSRAKDCFENSGEVLLISNRVLCAAIAGVALIAATPRSSAEQWPSRAIKVISPFTAGNAADTVARIVLDQVSRQLGQAFVIELVQDGRTSRRDGQPRTLRIKFASWKLSQKRAVECEQRGRLVQHNGTIVRQGTA